MESWSGGAGRTRGLAKRGDAVGRAWRSGCEGGAVRDGSIAPHPARRRKPGASDEMRRSAGAGTSGHTATQRRSSVKVRPISGREGRGRRESTWTPQRQGVKAISRLPNPRDARRSVRFRKSLDRRKSAAPTHYTSLYASLAFGRCRHSASRSHPSPPVRHRPLRVCPYHFEPPCKATRHHRKNAFAFGFSFPLPVLRRDGIMSA